MTSAADFPRVAAGGRGAGLANCALIDKEERGTGHQSGKTFFDTNKVVRQLQSRTARAMTRKMPQTEQSTERHEERVAFRSVRERTGPLGDLVTMRMIAFFSLLRKSGVLAQRRQFGLSEIEWRIMTHVGEHAPLSLNGLSELTLQDRGQLSRAVKGMVERGLLTRERKPGGPEIEIELSKKGRTLYSSMVERAIERDRRLTSDISKEDLETLWRITDVMILKADELLEEERQLGS